MSFVSICYACTCVSVCVCAEVLCANLFTLEKKHDPKQVTINRFFVLFCFADKVSFFFVNNEREETIKSCLFKNCV